MVRGETPNRIPRLDKPPAVNQASRGLDDTVRERDLQEGCGVLKNGRGDAPNRIPRLDKPSAAKQVFRELDDTVRERDLQDGCGV